MERHQTTARIDSKMLKIGGSPGFRGISDRLAVNGGRLTALASGESTTWEYTSPRITPPLGARTHADRQRVHVNAGLASRYLACVQSRSYALARESGAKGEAKGEAKASAATRRG